MYICIPGSSEKQYIFEVSGISSARIIWCYSCNPKRRNHFLTTWSPFTFFKCRLGLPDWAWIRSTWLNPWPPVSPDLFEHTWTDQAIANHFKKNIYAESRLQRWVLRYNWILFCLMIANYENLTCHSKWFQCCVANERLNVSWTRIPLLFIEGSFKSWYDGQVFDKFDRL